MNKLEFLALYDQDQRRQLDYPDMQKEDTSDVVRLVNPTNTGEGMIVYSQLTEANADRIIREQVEYFESIRQDFEWKVFDYDRPSDLKERLSSFGFIVKDAEALVVLDLENAPEILLQPVHHKVRRITDPEKLVDVQAVEEQVWNEDSSWVFNVLGNALRDYPDQMSVYVAYVDEQPASAAWIYFPKNSLFASLWGGATVNNFRKQGLFTSLVAIRAQEAIARQVRYLTVDAFPMSRPILEKLGFELIAYIYPCKWTANPNNESSTN